jgi:hypothetical protein
MQWNDTAQPMDNCRATARIVAALRSTRMRAEQAERERDELRQRSQFPGRDITDHWWGDEPPQEVSGIVVGMVAMAGSFLLFVLGMWKLVEIVVWLTTRL